MNLTNARYLTPARLLQALTFVALAVPCVQAQPQELPVYGFINKTETYNQPGPGLPILDEPLPRAFVCNVVAPFDLPSGQIIPPGKPAKDLLTDTGLGVEIKGLTYFDPFDTIAELDDAYPRTNDYRLTVSYSIQGVLFGEHNVLVPFSLRDYPPIPQLLNYDAAQRIPSAASFTLELAPFNGGTDLDQVTLQVYSDATTTNVIHSASVVPTNAGPIRILIPAGKLEPNVEYTARVLYDAFSGFGATNQTLLDGAVALPFYGRSSYSRANRFTLTAVVSTLLTVSRNPDAASLLIRFASQAGGSYALETSPDLATWREVATTNATGTTVEWTHPVNSAAEAREFIRVKASL